MAGVAATAHAHDQQKRSPLQDRPCRQPLRPRIRRRQKHLPPFVPPMSPATELGQCQRVTGPINKVYWCRLFARAHNRYDIRRPRSRPGPSAVNARVYKAPGGLAASARAVRAPAKIRCQCCVPFLRNLWKTRTTRNFAEFPAFRHILGTGRCCFVRVLKPAERV